MSLLAGGPQGLGLRFLDLPKDPKGEKVTESERSGGYSPRVEQFSPLWPESALPNELPPFTSGTGNVQERKVYAGLGLFIRRS